MMFGSSSEWWVIFMFPMYLWMPFGPFIMLTMGVVSARHPGWRARLATVLLPLLPVTVAGINQVFPTDTWDEETFLDDLLVGYVGVYVGLITVLPWLLGYLAVHYSRAVRAWRGRRRAGRTGDVGSAQPVTAGQEDISPPR